MCGLLGRSENAKANQVGHCVSVSVCAAVREGMCVCVSYLKGKGVKGGETSAKGTGTKRSLASPASDSLPPTRQCHAHLAGRFASLTQ